MSVKQRVTKLEQLTRAEVGRFLAVTVEADGTATAGGETYPSLEAWQAAARVTDNDIVIVLSWAAAGRPPAPGAVRLEWP